MSDTNAKIIEESGMRFGPFSPENLFYIEKSDAYTQLGKGFSTVEFVALWSGSPGNNVLFVEAKSSSPNPQNGMARFSEWIDEVAEKYEDSLQLYLSMETGIRDNAEEGAYLRIIPISEKRLKLVLVIATHQKEWLLPVSEALNRRLRKCLIMWKAHVVVLNREMALAQRLITE